MGTRISSSQALVGFIIAVTAFLAAASGANAQEQARVHKVGVLSAGNAASEAEAQSFRRQALAGFRQRMRELGYVDGQNLKIEYRFAGDRFERFDALAAELVRLDVDVIFVSSTPAAIAARRATTKIPIVITGVADPVGAGLVTSLGHPRGNVTGLSIISHELAGKRLELIRELVPNLSAVGALLQPDSAATPPQLKETRAAAHALGMRLQLYEARTSVDFEPAFAAMAKEGIGALVVIADTLFLTHHSALAELSLKHRLPTIYSRSEHARSGGLITYGPNLVEDYRQAAVYVGKILKGAKAGDLPVQLPTKYELVINARTAKALGLAIPSSLRIRADQIIH